VTADPVAWLVVEPGWDVVSGDGTGVGRVAEIVGDTNADIFNGLSVSAGLLRQPRYVPAELVRSITEGRVELSVSADEFERLGAYDGAPPGEEILPP
jgi:hypothetical protein